MTKSDPNELNQGSEEKQGAKQRVYFGGMLLSSRRKRRGLPPLIHGQETGRLIGIGLMNKAFDKEMREYLKDTPLLTPSKTQPFSTKPQKTQDSPTTEEKNDG